ncbi:uncharacterized protein BDCG_03933 [Blastomyces dermatitidis ER-3]|uniref:Protein kinase domain-containing protein n=1 Tax=Ajellomyces dermatitidis (strain ER-3 / ATCC MYA-2586) TaxID=559297 RepID=A0ABP2EXE6_AJEDR|nr:uncharacterized protein BDCG_03933 [Blastomyces dermatitidis ER-3]EEQ88813.2 hypothetical protein BDCG_03933 [Blastomyces dermatitidis ER-3]EQL29973.1 hypothetical protein BDFG_07461 [Blastomyces dermatitidis ATCC 26199]
MSDPLTSPLEMRQRNDIWAYGQLLSAMVGLNNHYREKKLMKSVAAAATTKDPESRPGLPCIISKLNVLNGG